MLALKTKGRRLNSLEIENPYVLSGFDSSVLEEDLTYLSEDQELDYEREKENRSEEKII